MKEKRGKNDIINIVHIIDYVDHTFFSEITSYSTCGLSLILLSFSVTDINDYLAYFS